MFIEFQIERNSTRFNTSQAVGYFHPLTSNATEGRIYCADCPDSEAASAEGRKLAEWAQGFHALRCYCRQFAC